MPSVQSKSVHEIKLNGGDLKRLQNGQPIEVDVGDSIIRLKSTAEDFAEDDTDLEDLESIKQEADEESEDKGDIVPENLEERDTGGNSRGRKTTADGEPKPFTNDEVKVGNKEENLSGMVKKE
jgi:hypothetical protein